MSDEVVLLQSPWAYTLVRERSGALRLDVLAGTVAQFEVRVRLDAQETLAYQREGAPFIERLAQAITSTPSLWKRGLKEP